MNIVYWPMTWRNDCGDLRFFEFESENTRLLTALVMAESPDIYEIRLLDPIETEVDARVRERIRARLGLLVGGAPVEELLREAGGG